jgi:hypothetical protein
LTYLRKVIQITVEDSPNVKLARGEIAAGLRPSNTIVLPGLITWEEFQKRERLWDEVRKTVGLYARFYKGAQVLLYPPDWLNRANDLAREYRNPKSKLFGRMGHGEAIGIDPGEGSANTAWAAVNKKGLIELVSMKTPDTDIISGQTIAFGKKHGVPPDKWMFDRGGGGKQIADRLRAKGYPVQTVAFGETIIMEPKRGKRLFQERTTNREEKYTYKNKRAEMYGILSMLIDPVNEGFAIPEPQGYEECPYTRLRKELAVFPKKYDGEGRMFLPPKNPPMDREHRKDSTREKSLVELIGFSPDESDALVLAVYGMCHKLIQTRAGAAVG